MAKTNENDETRAVGTAKPAAPARRRVPTRRATASDAAAPPAELGAAGAYAPSYEEIAEAAYLRYLQRGGNHGRDFDDWVEAERELRARR
jgi:hypothetical protein